MLIKEKEFGLNHIKAKIIYLLPFSNFACLSYFLPSFDGKMVIYKHAMLAGYHVYLVEMLMEICRCKYVTILGQFDKILNQLFYR